MVQVGKKDSSYSSNPAWFKRTNAIFNLGSETVEIVVPSNPQVYLTGLSSSTCWGLTWWEAFIIERRISWFSCHCNCQLGNLISGNAHSSWGKQTKITATTVEIPSWNLEQSQCHWDQTINTRHLSGYCFTCSIINCCINTYLILQRVNKCGDIRTMP